MRTVNTAQGTYNLGHRPSFVSQRLMYGEYEMTLMQKVMELTEPRKGQTLLDVGANIGVTAISCILAGWFENAVALEPEQENYDLLCENIELNGLQGRIIPLKAAASDKEGMVKIEINAQNAGDCRVRVETNRKGLGGEAGWATEEVPCVRLDILPDLDDLGMIWIDAQGHEAFIYEGARELIARGIPVTSEIWKYGIYRAGMQLQEFADLVKSLWKHYWRVDNGVFVKHPTDDFMTVFDISISHTNVVF